MQQQQQPYIVFAGLIGAGKTTAAHTVAKAFRWTLMLEDVSNNP